MYNYIRLFCVVLYFMIVQVHAVTMCQVSKCLKCP